MDLREFIDLLAREGYLRRVDREVDWRFELGEIARNNQMPLLFEKIKDYPKQRVFTNGMSSISSMALALGLRPGKRWRAFTTEARSKAATPIRPLVVDKGPVLENVVQAPEINFLDFPIPQWSKQDRGRYIGTWHINVSRDLETGSRNLGVYRMEVLGPNQATVSTSPKSHLAQHVAKAERAGRPLEMAVAIGTCEAVVMAGAAGCPYGTDEYDLAGGLQGESIRLVRCGTVNLEVPADSEIVIEGLIKPGVRVQDGPYFDYVGTANTNFNAFLFEATRLMFRSNPILRGTAVGRPGGEDQQLFSVLSELGLFDFHGLRPKHLIQAQLVKRRFFRAFQLVGRIGWKALVSRKKSFPPRVPSQVHLPTSEVGNDTASSTHARQP
jgi:4-hydroxy-3-polyprenylbenzoate decarboxylase